MLGMGRPDGSSPYGDHVRFLSNINGPLADLTRNALWSYLIVGSLVTVAIPDGIKKPSQVDRVSVPIRGFGLSMDNKEPTSGLEPLTCSLRVIHQALQGVA
jgi:hypothetical protein